MSLSFPNDKINDLYDKILTAGVTLPQIFKDEEKTRLTWVSQIGVDRLTSLYSEET